MSLAIGITKMKWKSTWMLLYLILALALTSAQADKVTDEVDVYVKGSWGPYRVC
jgi:hypothetical protein